MADTALRLFGAVPDSIVDGPGLRYAVFVQGCSHACPGCHNPESQPFDGGSVTTVDAVLRDVRANKLVRDVTLTGGDPFDQPAACAELASRLKAEGYGVWTYTGCTYESLLESDDPAVAKLLANTDVLVDGPFVESQKSLALKWRGSRNQRLIDLAATRASGIVTEWSSPQPDFPKPPSW